MLALINTNSMKPPIAPVGLDYLAAAVRQFLGAEVDLIDLCLAEDGEGMLRRYFADKQPELVGLSFRNVDDSFWPSMAWFVPELNHVVASVRALTDAPIVLGGTGFSIFPEQILQHTGADFGVCGDGEHAVISLLEELAGKRRFDRVPGLVWGQGGRVASNAPAWPGTLSLPSTRDTVDNRAYFRLGGQLGLETKRGCERRCIFCADRLAKGCSVRLRSPQEVSDEVESLLGQGVDVLHLCDSEFNASREHALAVCQEMISRGLGNRFRWYAYMAVLPFDAELAWAMSQAGCAGIDFTGPAASEAMLKAYRQPHRCQDIASAVRLCRQNGITVMLDLMLGGLGETPRTVTEAIEFVKSINPDCAGVGVGVRLYPHLPMVELVAAQGPLESNPGIRRRYDGPIDLLQPTFYVSPALGDHPAAMVRESINGDERFFEPSDDSPRKASDTGDRGFNYNDNAPLVAAIAAGARGAYWDILRRLGHPQARTP